MTSTVLFGMGAGGGGGGVKSVKSRIDQVKFIFVDLNPFNKLNHLLCCGRPKFVPLYLKPVGHHSSFHGKDQSYTLSLHKY